MNISPSLKSIVAEALSESYDSSVVHEIVNQYSTPMQLMDITVEQLVQFRGIGEAKAKRLCSAVRLARLLTLPRGAIEVIRSPRDVYELLRGQIAYENKEHFVVVFLSTKNHVIGMETIGVGSLNSAIVHPREVFKAAIRRSSASIVVGHNHPSGDTTPSPEDLNVTKRLVECGELLGISVLDSLIITPSSFASLKELGYM